MRGYFYQQCQHCKKTFTAKSWKARYCGATCRQRAHRELKQVKQDYLALASADLSQSQMLAIMLKLANQLDDKMYSKVYGAMRGRGEDLRAQQNMQKAGATVTNNVTVEDSFESARAGFKALAYHQTESLDAETVFAAIEDVREWLIQIENEMFEVKS